MKARLNPFVGLAIVKFTFHTEAVKSTIYKKPIKNPPCGMQDGRIFAEKQDYASPTV